MIGPEGLDAAESFDVEICTPAWIAKRHDSRDYPDVVLGRHMLIVFAYELEKIRDAIAQYCERCSGDTWMDIAPKLARLGAWEFEDYH